MDRLHEMEVFIAVADAGGFAKAGTRLRISPPAVTRAVSSLEARLGARLLNRTTRSLSLTEAGSRFLDDARRLVGEIDAAEKSAAGEEGAPRGHITATASVTLGRSLLTPIVSAFLAAHPHVSVSVLLLDRVVNLVEEGIDVSIRIGHLADSSLVAKRVGSVRRILVASPDYLRRRGIPGAPTDLRAHSVIGFSSLMPNRQWRFAGKQGTESVALSPRFEVNDAVAAITAAEAGDGITIALSYMVAERIRAGRLATVLEEFAPGEIPVQLVHPHTRLIAPSVRAFGDFMAPRLRDALAAVALEPGANATA